jgi:hypothetical protein
MASGFRCTALEPMLAKSTDELPVGEFLCEPKWDGFRASSRGAADVHQSRLTPSTLFPEPTTRCCAASRPLRAGREIVIATRGLDFEALSCGFIQPPRASRCSRNARPPPSRSTCSPSTPRHPSAHRRVNDAQLEELLTDATPPIYLTPMTRDRAAASDWLMRFEGAGLDGVMAKPPDGKYEPGKRAMFKIKHARTAECVVAGFRWHKSGRDAIGSLLLGLFDEKGRLISA